MAYSNGQLVPCDGVLLEKQSKISPRFDYLLFHVFQRSNQIIDLRNLLLFAFSYLDVVGDSYDVVYCCLAFKDILPDIAL